MTDDAKNLPARQADSSPGSARPRLWPLWLFALLALLVAIAAGLGAGYLWLERQATQEHVSSLQQDLNHLSDQISQSGSERSDRLARLENHQDAVQKRLEEQARQIEHNARELLEAGHRGRTDWLLAEAEYLLRMANQRLQLEKDIEGAIAILRSADEVLAETDDPGVYPVRQAVAEARMDLKSVEQVDRIGLYLQLEAAITQIEKLSDSALTQFSPLAQTEPVEEPTTTADSTWEKVWQRFVAGLDDVIVIRRLDEPVKPLLSPKQSAYARLNLRLMLEEAEMALLKGNTPLYRRSLQKAQGWLDEWYDTSHPTVNALIESLDSMAQRQINPDLPDISEPLQLLKARIEGRLAPSEKAPAKQPSKSSGDSESAS
ncbi:uroporphyrinogen-III C-methyltransferase [Marinobacteraceae bacterium S3BR75-40.1]